MGVRRRADDRARPRGGAFLVARREGLGAPDAGGLTAPDEKRPPSAALEHLAAADPVMAALVERHGPLSVEERRRGRPPDPYGALVRTIVGQQLSTKAARTIYERLAAPYDGRAPTPAELLAADPEDLRAAGLSRGKVAYLRDLAERVSTGDLDLEGLVERADEEVAAELTRIKGLGQWSADMYLIFHLGRPDVLPVGDLGVRRAVERAYNLDDLPEPSELTALAEPWRPHRSLASLYLWRSLDNEPT